ncbi:MAG: hypothetical protein ACQSGP_29400 [Frankia sp.]
MSQFKTIRPRMAPNYGYRPRRRNPAVWSAVFGAVMIATVIAVHFIADAHRRTTTLQLTGIPPPMTAPLPAPRQGSAPNAASIDPRASCTLTVPPDPLSARGLATPYRLASVNGGACDEANLTEAAFVQATIIDPATGRLSVYNPLVINNGTTPAVSPVVPAIPAGAVVGVWFGFNGNALTLSGGAGAATARRDDRRMDLIGVGRSLTEGACVEGTGGSTFGQFAYCNAPAFFRAATAAIAAGRLVIPALGTGADGLPCPTVRDFGMVDQDPSDNVTAPYLVTANGATAQATAANTAAFPRATVLGKIGDNGLLVTFLDQALGCAPFTAPDLANGGRPATSIALNELQAAAHQAAPVALVPPNDPMTTANGAESQAMVDLYRAGVGQPDAQDLQRTAVSYCRTMIATGRSRLVREQALDQKVASPQPAVASNLFTFLGLRLRTSFDSLGCGKLLGVANPVTIRANDGVAVAVAVRDVLVSSP